MPYKNDHDEMFGSLKKLPGGSNDRTGLAIVCSVAVAILGAVVLAGLGVKGGLPTIIVILLVFGTYRSVKNA